MAMNENTGHALPLLFTYSGLIMGRGFLASVTFCGRLLAWQETEGVWIDGINPGGFAVGGKNLHEANLALRETLTKVLVDFSFETPSFDAFRAEVERFYLETDDSSVGLWDSALEALKAGTLTVPAGLQRKPSEWTCHITIEPKRLEDLTASDNSVNAGAVDTALPEAA